MQRLQAITASSGIAVGHAAIITRQAIEIAQTTIDPEHIQGELLRFDDGVKQVITDLDELIRQYAHSRDNRDILTTHKMILMDPEFLSRVRSKITKDLFSVEQAIHTHFLEVVELFKQMDNEYFAQRSVDYEDVSYRLLSHLQNKSNCSLDSIEPGAIIFSESIAPSDISRVIQQNIGGICLHQGTRNSHSAIIARSMNVPMLINIKEIDQVTEGMQVIVDGNTGELLLMPDDPTLHEYQTRMHQQEAHRQELQTLVHLPAITMDGHTMVLRSNIEIPEEMAAVLQSNSQGIGLFRTEFLFMGSNHLPSESEQYETYRTIVQQAAPHSVTIRTIDVGGDKLSALLNLEKEANPNLGCRGIRLSLAQQDIFNTQIRAILRAAAHGSIKMMFPMISSLDEVRQIKAIIARCGELLTAKDQAWAMPQLGVMIEVPSAAIIADMLAAEVDFMSIGTNDLVQYTLAVDRDNTGIEQFYQTTHPAVLRLIRTAAQQAHAHGIPIAVCGEMAGDPTYIPLLIGLGIRELSMSPSRLLEVKKIIRSGSYGAWQNLAQQALGLPTAHQIEELLKEGTL